MPPAWLMSATACSTPSLNCKPKAALPPLIGPAAPRRIEPPAGAEDAACASAGTGAARSAAPRTAAATIVGLLGLDIGDLAVGSLLPDVEHVAIFLLAGDSVAGHVTLLVGGEVAEHGLEHLAGMHHLGDLLGIERLRLLGRLLDDLDRGVAVERIGLRLEALLAEDVDDLLVRRVGARVGREGHQRALGAWPRDRGEFVVGDAIGSHGRPRAP